MPWKCGRSKQYKLVKSRPENVEIRCASPNKISGQIPPEVTNSLQGLQYRVFVTFLSFTTFHNFPCYESTWHATLLRSISHPPQLAPGMQWVCSFRRWHQGWAFGAVQLRFRHLKNWHDNHDITNWFCYAQFSWKPCSSMHSSMHIHHIHTMSYLFHSQLCRWSNNSLSNLYAHGESEAVGAWYQIYPACPEDLTLWVGVAWPGRPGSWSVPPPKFGQREGESGSASSLPSMKTYENYGDSRARTKNDIDWNSPGYSSMK